MNQFKRAQIIMLPTKDKSIIYNCEGMLLYDNKIIKSIPIWKDSHQHLYIISDDEIKEGDWYLAYDKTLCQRYASIPLEGSKKIIATTDTSLYYPVIGSSTNDISLPQPSQQFIEKYIESYNKGEIITDVLVEEIFPGGTNSPWKLKINPKDNTITIKKLKNSWNREEIEELFKQYKNYEVGPSNWCTINLKNWLNKNL